MTAIYNVMELATALKPFLLRHLLAAGAPSVTYLDPDIEVFAPLDDVAGAAERHGIVLTPHRLTAVPADGRQPDERAFLVSGAYNLGFVAVGPAGAGFLDWWADRCGRDCLHDVPDGLFVDQRWVDVAAAYFPPLVLRDPGLNVAYWNVDERPIEATPGGGHRAGGAPLRFLHYSGYDPDAGHQLTRYHEGRPRVLLSEDPALRALCAAYGERLRAEGWDECRKLDYGLAFAANGMVLDGLMRRIVRQELLRRERTLEHDAGDVDAVPDPYEPGEVDAFVALLRSPFPGSAAPRISRYLHALHHSRPDLQSACPHLTGPSGNHFLAWIRSIGQRDLGLPPEVIPAADEIEGDVGAPAERPAGVRLVGYLDAELGMGELGRGLLSALRAAGEPVVTATETVTLSRRRHDAGVRDGEDDAEDARRRRCQRGLRQRRPAAHGDGPARHGLHERPVHDRRVGVGGRGVPRALPRLGRPRGRGVDLQRPRPGRDRRRGGRAGAPRASACAAAAVGPPAPARARPSRRLHLPVLLRLLQRGRPQEPLRRHRRLLPGVRPRRGPAPAHQVHQRRGGPRRPRARAPARGRARRRARGRRVRVRRRAGRARRRLRRVRVAAPGRGLRLHDGRGDARGPAGRGDRVLGEPRVHGRPQQRPRGLRPRADRRGQGPLPRGVAVGGPRPRRGRGGDAAPRRRPGGGGRAGRARPAGHPSVPQRGGAGAPRGRPAGVGPLGARRPPGRPGRGAGAGSCMGAGRPARAGRRARGGARRPSTGPGGSVRARAAAAASPPGRRTGVAGARRRARSPGAPARPRGRRR